MCLTSVEYKSCAQFCHMHRLVFFFRCLATNRVESGATMIVSVDQLAHTHISSMLVHLTSFPTCACVNECMIWFQRHEKKPSR